MKAVTLGYLGISCRLGGSLRPVDLSICPVIIRVMCSTSRVLGAPKICISPSCRRKKKNPIDVRWETDFNPKTRATLPEHHTKDCVFAAHLLTELTADTALASSKLRTYAASNMSAGSFLLLLIFYDGYGRKKRKKHAAVNVCWPSFVFIMSSVTAA